MPSLYIAHIEQEVKRAYDLAETARHKGYDPVDHVETPLARNMAERVVGLISIVAPQLKNTTIVSRIKELELQYAPLDWRVALSIALEVAQEKYCSFNDKKEAMEVGIRLGIAYITNGVVSSPLEGFTRLDIRKRRDGQEYIALFFSGPIRSAGGTAAAVSVVIGDYVRKHFGYADYDPSPDEIKRLSTELYDYHDKVTNLQYLPSEQEIEYLVSHIPVQIEGDPSEKYDVSNYKGLDRVTTDRIRNGPCLVIGEGIAQKATKLYKQLSKWGKEFDLSMWEFLGEFLKLQKSIKSKQAATQVTQDVKIKPDYTYIKDLVAGRPVFSHPLAKGGFRLRYGRGRNSGLSAQALHPATMVVLNRFVAIGTQFKVERPGKSTVIGVCDVIQGPVVKLQNGDVLYLESVDEAKKVLSQIVEILYLGDLLICYGDFLNRAHALVPVGYCEEWWIQDLEKNLAGRDYDEDKPIIDALLQDIFHVYPTVQQAVLLCERYHVPLHPRYTFFWTELSREDLLILVSWYQYATKSPDKLIFPLRLGERLFDREKRMLEILGVPHQCISQEHIVIDGDSAAAFQKTLEHFRPDASSVLEMLNPGLHIRDKSGTYIGARMGRPEKAKMRKLTGSPQVLFPVGAEGGRLRSFQSALEKGYIRGEFPVFHCLSCKCETIYSVCETCDTKTKKLYVCRYCGTTEKSKCHPGASLPYKRQQLDIKKYFTLALKRLNIQDYPKLIKGVRGTSNREHIPEHLAKGILRAKHNIYVNKDGTIRYDITEMPLTHFRPKEIGTTVARLQDLGYTQDIYGKDLVSDLQILEIKCQDVVLPGYSENLEESAAEIFFRVARFIDELLASLYRLPPFYNLKTKDDLVGHLIVGLAPHTSAGIVGRIIGFSKVQAFLAHPLFHSIMRRDCDGDESCAVLLFDTLLNFSRLYLPNHRGATQDAPLVLSSQIIPREVDDMVFDMDVVFRYPLELYEAASQYKNPWDVQITTLRKYLDVPGETWGFGFTHNTDDINDGVRCSSYKSLPTMQDKVLGQMDLAEKIRAVNTDDVAKLVIERHFIRDIKGNLRKFSTQQFRCVDCNEKYRRPPLVGKCMKCGGRIIFTVSEGSITKYLEPSLQLAQKYNLSPYLKQNLELTKMRIESIFGRDAEKQEGLGKWFY